MQDLECPRDVAEFPGLSGVPHVRDVEEPPLVGLALEAVLAQPVRNLKRLAEVITEQAAAEYQGEQQGGTHHDERRGGGPAPRPLGQALPGTWRPGRDRLAGQP